MDYVEVPRLIPELQRCNMCVKANKNCVKMGMNSACELCRSKKIKCIMPEKADPIAGSSSISSSVAPSLPSSLARGVESLGVSDSAVKTPSRKDKRKKIEIGSSPEEQPPRRRSKTNLKTADSVDSPSEDSPEAGKTKAKLEKRIGMLEENLSNLKSFYSKSVESLQQGIEAVREELAEESKAKGKGKGKV